MKVQAILKNYRTTPRKIRVLIPLVKGCFVDNALVQLEHNVHRASHQLKKLIISAVSNAEHNFHIDKKSLIVENVLVGEGTKLKRWMSRAFGRATPVLKRTSTVTVVLSEALVVEKEGMLKAKSSERKKGKEKAEKEKLSKKRSSDEI